MLTLKETLTFALRTKTPGVRLPDETRRMFRQRVMDAILKMFGLVNQSRTVRHKQNLYERKLIISVGRK